ncbi:NAD-dependent epimerase/dehydratase family protein [Sporolactobacillus spathodeae]|uniref:UDP-glucose 4-epimerase n=1 Tax=Sporolactobacillus spathodeae TaxID=1465502 RepID=A0ABS2QCX0_9BACL|nr:NAD-dependent epimerase/dehydratase family protein [Sporolactobacillus spathodeae]MBM7658782.1 UDP-glucose 4-epimerase [Sporolactobacillus spathodeae]
MEKVIVTGGAGFIGSHTVEQLLREGYQVAVIDNFTTGHQENIADLPVDVYVCDIADSAVIELIKSIKPDYIIHLAAQVSVAQSVEDPLFDQRINIQGSLNVMNGARFAGARKIVFASSAAVYGNPSELPVTTRHPTRPESPYGLAKLTVEHYLQLFQSFYQLPYAILRFSNVYGPRQDAAGEGGVISIFCERLHKGTPPMIYGDGEQTRDFIYVQDVARALAAALKLEENLCVNVSNGSSVTINQLFQQLRAVAHSDCSVYYGPARPGDIRHSMLANDETKRLLGWKPLVSLEKGLRETLDDTYRRMKKAGKKAVH